VDKLVFGLLGPSMALTRVGRFKTSKEFFERDVAKPPPAFVSDVVKSLGSVLPVDLLRHARN
jgi:hypothetical protein